jgi:predicted amidohydrolase YtcJ
MDDAQPRAQAVAVEGERISAIGDDDVVLAGKRADTTLIDLEGRTLMPGFVDAHTHLLNDAEQTFDMSLDEVQQLALENGITTIGNLYTNEAFLDEISEYAQSGRLRLRTSLYLVATDNCGRSEGDWWQAHAPTRSPGEMLRIGGVKIFTDGGTCERPALTYETEAGAGLGDLFLTQQALNDLVSAVQGAGHQVAIHAIGDRAVEQAQNAIEAALDGQPNTWRHRIEHNSVVRPELLPRYGELGIVPVIFGQYPTCEPFGTPPAAYEAWEWPWRALLDANPGLPIAWHGDDPFFGQVRPLDDLYSLVTRNEVAADGTVCRAPAW